MNSRLRAKVPVKAEDLPIPTTLEGMTMVAVSADGRQFRVFRQEGGITREVTSGYQLRHMAIEVGSATHVVTGFHVGCRVPRDELPKVAEYEDPDEAELRAAGED